jgi:hypothetical protein
MNDPVKKSRSGWMIAGLVVGALLACVAVLWVVLSSIGTTKIEQMRALAAARRAEMRALDPARPTLRGASEPGNAFDDYTPAMDAVKATPDINKLGEIFRRGPKADSEFGKTTLNALAGVIDQIHRGAGRAGAKYPYDWEKGLTMPTPNLTTATSTATLVTLKSRALAEEGKGREAAGLLLDVLQFGRDLGSDGVLIVEMIGYAMIGTALEELRSQLNEDRLDKAALEDLDRGLATLEKTLPDHGRALMNDLLLTGGLNDPGLVGGWTPLRLVFANAVEETTGMMARAAKAETVSWAECLKVNAQIEADAKQSWNPVTKIAVPSTEVSSRNVRVRVAQIRMMRVAVHRAATGELLDLDDPFGTKLKTAKTEPGFKIWSIGQDGVDDGGTGAWKNEGKDLVLELKK